MNVYREEDGRKKIKMLQKEIKRVKAEKESELQKRNEMVSHLKDQLQELKAKSIMEGKYVEKCANVSVAHIQKKCRLSEKELKDEVEVSVGCSIHNRSHDNEHETYSAMLYI